MGKKRVRGKRGNPGEKEVEPFVLEKKWRQKKKSIEKK